MTDALGLQRPRRRGPAAGTTRSSTRSPGHRRRGVPDAAPRRSRDLRPRRRGARGADPASLVAAARDAGGLDRRGGRRQRGGAAVRRHRDDRGDDRQRAPPPALDPDALALVRADRARCAARSRSRCGSSRRPRSSTATRRATSCSAAPRSRAGDLVSVSIAGGQPRPGRVRRSRPLRRAPRERPPPPRVRRSGPHVCLGCTSRAWRRTRRCGARSSACPGSARPGAPDGPARARLPQAAAVAARWRTWAGAQTP